MKITKMIKMDNTTIKRKKKIFFFSLILKLLSYIRLSMTLFHIIFTLLF